MGAAEAPPGRDRDEFLGELEDYVKDSILTTSGDPVLAKLIEIVLDADRESLFPLALDEPVLFRRIRRFILEGIRERLLVAEVARKAIGSERGASPSL